MQRVEYLQTDGNCCIITDLDITTVARIEVYDSVLKIPPGYSNKWRAFITAGTSSPFLFVGQSNRRVELLYSDGSVWYNTFPTDTLTISKLNFTHNYFELNGVRHDFDGFKYFSQSTGGLLTIFARQGKGDMALAGSRIGNVKAYDEKGVLVYDGYPYIDNNDTPCFYDTVNGTASYEANGGTLTTGPDVPFYVISTSDTSKYEGGTYNITIGSDDTWTATITKGSDFVSLDAMTGSAGETAVDVTLSANTLRSREWEIVFSNGTYSTKLSGKQSSPLKYWRPLEYIVTDGTQYFKTDYVPNMETSMEYKMRKADRAVSIDCCDAWIGQEGSDDGDGGVNGRNFCIRGSVSCVFGNSGNRNYSVPNFDTSTDHVFVMDNTGFTVDGVQGGTWSPTAFQNKRPLSISATYKFPRYGAQRFYHATLSENGSTVCGLRAAQSVQGQVGVVDSVTGKMYYPFYIDTTHTESTNPLGKGALEKLLTSDRYSMAFEPAGGEYEMTVTSDTTWQCTAATGYTISPMSGSAGTTTVTVTAAPNAGTEKIKAVSTFYDAEGYAFDLKLSTKAAGGHCEMYLGTVDLSEVKFGTYDVSKIMMGDVEVYGAGAFSGLKVSPSNTMLFNTDQGTLRIKSSESWTITDIPAWLTLSKTSGTAGTFQITMTPTQPSENRTATMTVTTANYSSTFTVDNRPVTLVDYIHNSTLKNYPEMTTSIDIGVTAKTNTMFNVKGLGKGYASSGITVGFYNGNDRADYRYFNYNNLTVFDMNALRLESNPLDYGNNKPIDVTCGNYYVTNNITGKTQAGETQAQILDTTSTLKVDMGSWWFQSLKIWEGSTLVFDGHAALDPNDVASIYDAVSDTYFTNPNLTLVAETV